ncbi:restriction endonuclease subunit S [Paracoccus sp. NSM]|uniref:restriction endonuclease subunit S n=1 Tax=Paracoccus sp. NSM TaxID=3457784 RepID=UPI004036904D
MKELPESWTDVEIIEVLAPHENGRPFQQGWSPQCENHPAKPEQWGVLKTTAIQHGEFWPQENKALPSGLAPRPQIEVKVGDVLMTCAGPRNRCGVACLIEATPARLMMSGKMYRFRPRSEVLDPKYLAYLIQRRDTQLEIDRMKTGINDSGLNLTHDRFSQLRVPLPPLPEQRRIVAKIEALFSELDAGQQSLLRAQAQLGLYRQSLLKAAFEGRLTADWRAANPDKLEDPETLLARIRAERDARYKQALDDWQNALSEWRAGGEVGLKPAKPRRPEWPDAPAYEDLAELPEGWAYAPFECLAYTIRNGISKKPQESGSLKIFRISAVRSNFFDLSDFRFLESNDALDNFRLRPGDLVFTRYNGSRAYVGVAALYNGDGSHVYPDKLIRCDLNSSSLVGGYVEKAVNSGESRAFIESRVRTTAGQAGISGADLKAMPVPLCSLAEQREIQTLLEANLSQVTAMEAEITTTLAKINALRQSILKQAFSGLLVPQDPSDEPASALLARLRPADLKTPPSRRRKRQA